MTDTTDETRTRYWCWECRKWIDNPTPSGVSEDGYGPDYECSECEIGCDEITIPVGEPMPPDPAVGQYGLMAVVTMQDGNRMICAHHGERIGHLVTASLWWGDQDYLFDAPGPPDPDGIWVWEGWVEWTEGGYYHPQDGDWSVRCHRWRRPTDEELARFANGGLMFKEDP